MVKIRETVRSDLRCMVKGGATSRILDLYSIEQAYGPNARHSEAPFFRNSRLNRCFIVKHIVRSHERSYVSTRQPVVTKIVVPLAGDDLSLGGFALFVEEVGFLPKMKTLFDAAEDSDTLDLDIERLRELAALPSFDPFLLSERYGEHERPVDPLYFNIAGAELDAMEASVGKQIVSVIALAFEGAKRDKDDARAEQFARQLLAGDVSGRIRMLRQSLGMSAEEFRAGMFGWRGILYYRWNMEQSLATLKRFVRELDGVSFVGTRDLETSQLEEMRRSILLETHSRWSSLTKVMGEYEKTFSRFCNGEDATGFRNFLLKAPSLFFDLGSDMSAVSHVPGYWSFWRSKHDRNYLHAREAFTLFASFMASLRRFEPGCDPHLDAGFGSPIPPPEVFIPPAA